MDTQNRQQLAGKTVTINGRTIKVLTSYQTDIFHRDSRYCIWIRPSPADAIDAIINGCGAVHKDDLRLAEERIRQGWWCRWPIFDGPICLFRIGALGMAGTATIWMQYEQGFIDHIRQDQGAKRAFENHIMERAIDAVREGMKRQGDGESVQDGEENQI